MPPGEPRPARARVRFDDIAWRADLGRSTPAGVTAATRVRRVFERDGVPIDQLRPCAEEGRDGTRLAGCVKVYVPAPAGPWGIVFHIDVDAEGALLTALAFGPRHPSDAAPSERLPARRRTVACALTAADCGSRPAPSSSRSNSAEGVREADQDVCPKAPGNLEDILSAGAFRHSCSGGGKAARWVRGFEAP